LYLYQESMGRGKWGDRRNHLLTSGHVVEFVSAQADLPQRAVVCNTRVTKKEKLVFQVTGRGTGSGSIKGVMAFDRKEYGMNSGIPFIKIADRVEVTVDLKGKRVSGPPVVFKE
jgi:hypothetical protein